MKKLFLLLAFLPVLVFSQTAPAIGGFIQASTTAGGSSPTGAAGGVLSGTYPNPGFGSFASATLATAISDETGTGFAVFSASPILTTPTISTITAAGSTDLTLNSGSGSQNINLLSGTGQVIIPGGATLPPPQAGFALQANAFITFEGVAGSPLVQFRRTNTSAASPSNVLNNNTLMSIGVKGYKATGYSGSSGVLVFSATQDWTDTAIGTQFAVQVTPNNSTSAATKLLLTQAGNTLFGGLTTDGGGSKQLQLAGTGQINFGATANATIGVSADTTAGVMQFTAPNGTGSMTFATGTATTALTLDASQGVTVAGGLTTNKGRVVSVTTNTATSLTLDATMHVVTLNNASAVAVTLPALASNAGRTYRIKNLGAGIVTVTANAAENIFANANVNSFNLATGDSVDLTATAANWLVE